ncbi:SDR family oxidoreductase [Alicyclobacillus acidoterrestris]|uniref:SDR family NAD(P)-dependent oxidoreductase n=1 Tax=Alicyclobacillus acidoterrestris (strain ATCC 49025 / DSM 3922 / CIP 106132 / NCIMB 13137 / GD3B) TaxID=1356854 RepID=T0C813_ALIAG|nr:SDR family NAD(P)-dependent oxidoreductase [Alicyclobacillus acidoterrestris]EPZ49059.1 hypothetical protein N007_04255 [Alicyclobacillus acidoterrestris ATCC 49025]UNO47580.1 SDR family NAD(P)-dependent oxidoreductase [Alicyclobacillus acidoterrestris]
MKMEGNTILITGGASGIGLAFAERFLEAGNDVIICGRREDKLQAAKQKYPALHTRVCDVSKPADREALYTYVTSEFPELNVLVNNAGIQQRVDVLCATRDWNDYSQEIAANLEGPIHLTLLFVPHLRSRESAAVVNVSSGLAITPAAWAPIYSATKAGLHAFSMTLRLQLADTNVEVIEILPPAVNTDLGGIGLHTFGAPLDVFADGVFDGLRSGKSEIGFGGTQERLQFTKSEVNEAMRSMWLNFLHNNPEFRKDV